MEATAGIEPAYTDLQSAASPLRHVASNHSEQMGTVVRCPQSNRSGGNRRLIAYRVSAGRIYHTDKAQDKRGVRFGPIVCGTARRQW